MRAHVIQAGRVVNTIEVLALDALPGLTLIDADQHGGGIGDAWDGQAVAPAIPTAAEIAARWAAVRAERTAMLLASDFTQLPDVPGDRPAWAQYRQALRDITLQADPFAIVWPAPPAAGVV